SCQEVDRGSQAIGASSIVTTAIDTTHAVRETDSGNDIVLEAIRGKDVAIALRRQVATYFMRAGPPVVIFEIDLKIVACQVGAPRGTGIVLLDVSLGGLVLDVTVLADGSAGDRDIL